MFKLMANCEQPKESNLTDMILNILTLFIDIVLQTTQMHSVSLIPEPQNSLQM